jgi:hypothetical protein
MNATPWRQNAMAWPPRSALKMRSLKPRSKAAFHRLEVSLAPSPLAKRFCPAKYRRLTLFLKMPLRLALARRWA